MTETYPTTMDLTIDQLHSLAVGDGGGCPGSYANNADDAAWYAVAGLFIVWNANGSDGDDYTSLDYYMGLAVNGSEQLVELIFDNWETVPVEVRDMLAEDQQDFAREHQSYLLNDDYVDQATAHYLACGLWATPSPVAYEDENQMSLDGIVAEPRGENMDDFFNVHDCVDDDEVREEVEDFIVGALHLLRPLLEMGQTDWEQIGHDFFLTRNGHGTGFWDRGLGDVGIELSDMCKPYGEANFEPEGWREPTEEERDAFNADPLNTGDVLDSGNEVAVRNMGEWSIFNFNDYGFTAAA